MRKLLARFKRAAISAVWCGDTDQHDPLAEYPYPDHDIEVN
jgi:hypothetical protein